MKQYKVAVLGATGAVGREMIKILEERRFPVGELKLLSSERSAGKKICFYGEDLPVAAAEPSSFSGCDIVLGASPNKIAVRFMQNIVDAGAVFIDNSSAFRLHDDVPLVVPEINPGDIKKHRGVISNPNCATIIALVAVNPINKLSKITKMTVSTYQAVSGAGAGGPVELFDQIRAVFDGKRVEKNVFPRQIAYNLIPKIGDFCENGYTTEEMKMQNEGRKILHLPSLKVSCTCVRVPVVRCHSEAISVTTERRILPEEARREIISSEGCRLSDNTAENIYPTPLDASGGDTVLVGRVREDIANENTLSLWCVGDQIRKGAAANAVQIAEKLIAL